MRRPPFAYPRAEMQARVIARLEGGYPVRVLCRLEGYPSYETLYRWAREDPGFAVRMQAARDWGGAERGTLLLARKGYDEARAEVLLKRVRLGEPLRVLVKTPGQPNSGLLRAWKKERPDFAAALAEAVLFSRRMGGAVPRPLAYDEAVADRIILRVIGGESLRAIQREAGGPGRATLERWRRSHPEFDTALAYAGRANRRAGTGRLSPATPALMAKIVLHVRRGGSLRSAARTVRGSPRAKYLYEWTRRFEAFGADVAAAKAERDDRLADRVLAISEQATAETVAAAELRIGLLKRRLAQLSGGRKRKAR